MFLHFYITINVEQDGKFQSKKENVVHDNTWQHHNIMATAMSPPCPLLRYIIGAMKILHNRMDPNIFYL